MSERITDAPQKIWLNYGDVLEGEQISANDCEEVTWCDNPINDSDVPYVRANEAEALRKAYDDAMNDLGWFFNSTDHQAEALHHLERKYKEWEAKRQALTSGGTDE